MFCIQISREVRHFLIASTVLLGVLLHGEARAAQVTFSWDYTASGAAGFALYCGTSSGQYSTRIDVGNRTSYVLTGLAAGSSWFCVTTAYDAARLESPYSAQVSVAIPAGPVSPPPVVTPTTSFSLWAPGATPIVPTDGDVRSTEVGVKFSADRKGTISGMRFFKSSTNTGSHVASLWSAGGVLLGRATFASESASGWQQVNFATPVAIAAGVTYVASYHTDTGHYADDIGAFVEGLDNGPLHVLPDTAESPNGVYAYAATSTFPTTGWQASNYWVDVIFQPSP